MLCGLSEFVKIHIKDINENGNVNEDLKKACIVLGLDVNEAIEEAKRLNRESIMTYSDAVDTVLCRIMKTGKIKEE